MKRALIGFLTLWAPSLFVTGFVFCMRGSLPEKPPSNEAIKMQYKTAPIGGGRTWTLGNSKGNASKSALTEGENAHDPYHLKF